MFSRFAWGVLAYNILVVLWGAFVRASRSGDGCGNNWPLCNGNLVPRAPQVQTVIEFTHRITVLLAFAAIAGQGHRDMLPGEASGLSAASRADTAPAASALSR